MKLKDIINLAGTATALVNPVIGGAIMAINKAVPYGDSLPSHATVSDIKAKLDTLPPDVREPLLERDIELQLAEIKSHTDIQTALAAADSTGSSTRPDIARLFAWAVVLVEVPIAWGITYVVFSSDDPLDSLAGCWPLILAMVTPLVTVIGTYFGKRTDEKKARYAVAHGQQIPEAVTGLIGSLLKK